MKITFPAIVNSLLFMIMAIVLSSSPLQAQSNNKYTRSVERYTVPNVSLINQDGKKVQLTSLLNGERPVVVNFIYGTCTTICPVLSAGFVNLQGKLGAASADAQLVSITIDPENDSPKVMKQYLMRYRAKPGWTFLTGSRRDIDTVMKAFDAYIPDKMSHYPLNFIRSPKDGSWVRLFGIMSSSELMNEFQMTTGKR